MATGVGQVDDLRFIRTHRRGLRLAGLMGDAKAAKVRPAREMFDRKVIAHNTPPPAARPFAESVMLNPDVINISIEDATLGEFLVLKSKARLEGQLLRDTRPVVYDGQTIGKVTIEMTTADLERQLLWDFNKAAILLLIQILVSVTFLVALFDRRVIRPLNRLQGDLKRLSEGDLGIKVSADRDDEIGELAAGVDHMRERLNEKIAEAGELNVSLERRVSDLSRTAVGTDA